MIVILVDVRKAAMQLPSQGLVWMRLNSRRLINLVRDEQEETDYVDLFRKAAQYANTQHNERFEGRMPILGQSERRLLCQNLHSATRLFTLK